jgi:colicin import membrane protein
MTNGRKGHDGNELDQFWSAKFLEDNDKAITALERKAALKEIDKDNNGHMSLIEYMLWKFKKTVAAVANAAQGEDKEALEECQRQLAAVQAAIEDVQAKLAAQKAALEAQRAALEAQKIALAEQQRVVAEVTELLAQQQALVAQVQQAVIEARRARGAEEGAARLPGGARGQRAEARRAKDRRAGSDVGRDQGQGGDRGAASVPKTS